MRSISKGRPRVWRSRLQIWRRNTRCVVLVDECIYVHAYLISRSPFHQASKAELKKIKEEFEEFEKQMDSL